MHYKLIINDQISLEQLQNEVEKGGTFVMYQYCISILLVLTLRRFSPAYYIPANESKSKYKAKYNWLSSIFGWWGIPWGIVYTLSSYKINGKGGIDVTEDIMLNIDESSLANKKVEIEYTNQLFIKPSKDDTKEFRKVIKRYFQRDARIKRIVVGEFINTDEYEDPYFTVGLLLDGDFDTFIPKFEKALYIRFRKITKFEFVDLSKDEAVYRVLEEQGIDLLDSKSN